METVKLKLELIKKAQASLRKMIDLFAEHKKKYAVTPSDKLFEVMIGLRDSMIQRFEYNTDFLWKYLKLYMVEKLKYPVQANSPKEIVREAVKMALLTESEGKLFIKMLDSRNLTSHIYHEDIAQEIADQIPGYYNLMHEILEKSQP